MSAPISRPQAAQSMPRVRSVIGPPPSSAGKFGTISSRTRRLSADGRIKSRATMDRRSTAAKRADELGPRRGRWHGGPVRVRPAFLRQRHCGAVHICGKSEQTRLFPVRPEIAGRSGRRPHPCDQRDDHERRTGHVHHAENEIELPGARLAERLRPLQRDLLRVREDARGRIAEDAGRQALQVRPGQVDLEDGENIVSDEWRDRLNPGFGDRLPGGLGQNQERQCRWISLS